MGDVEHRLGAGLEEILQPLQGIQVQITGGFIQQKYIRLFHQQDCQLQLDLLSSGQGRHGLIAGKQRRGNGQQPGQGSQLSGRLGPEG